MVLVRKLLGGAKESQPDLGCSVIKELAYDVEFLFRRLRELRESHFRLGRSSVGVDAGAGW